MPTFTAGSFSDIADTNLGRGLWDFLNTKESLIRLETSTYSKRPALEGLQVQLIEKFGNAIRGDRWKQLIGRMTRQVMEQHGYILAQTGARIRVGDLFTSAAKYVKK